MFAGTKLLLEKSIWCRVTQNRIFRVQHDRSTMYHVTKTFAAFFFPVEIAMKPFTGWAETAFALGVNATFIYSVSAFVCSSKIMVLGTNGL